MTDLAITAANVIAAAGAETEPGTFGATIVAGKTVYRDAADGKYKLADNNAAAAKGLRGIALNGGGDGQPGMILRKGRITIGATLSPGARYYLSDTAGGIIPEADLNTGMDVILIGIAVSASVLEVNIINSGVTLAGA